MQRLTNLDCIVQADESHRIMLEHIASTWKRIAEDIRRHGDSNPARASSTTAGE